MRLTIDYPGPVAPADLPPPPCPIWLGRTGRGVECLVFVAKIDVEGGNDPGVRIDMASTDLTGEVDGLECRTWEGRTRCGAACLVYVHRIAADTRQDHSEFEEGLAARPAGWPADGTGNGPAA